MATKKTATKTAPKTAAKQAPKTAEKIALKLKATRNFIDRNGKEYKAGDTYEEISTERTKALMTAEVSDLNTIGDIFLTEGE